MVDQRETAPVKLLRMNTFTIGDCKADESNKCQKINSLNSVIRHVDKENCSIIESSDGVNKCRREMTSIESNLDNTTFSRNNTQQSSIAQKAEISINPEGPQSLEPEAILTDSQQPPLTSLVMPSVVQRFSRWPFRLTVVVLTALLIQIALYTPSTIVFNDYTLSRGLSKSMKLLPYALSRVEDEALATIRGTLNLLRIGSEHHKVAVLMIVSTASNSSDHDATGVTKQLVKVFRASGLRTAIPVYARSVNLQVDLDKMAMGHQVLIIRHVEQMTVPWLLYRYCDPESPAFPYKLFVLTCAFGRQVKGASSTKQVELENYLRQRWLSGVNDKRPTGFGVEQIDPLFSRIANNIVFVDGS